ncbi:hypothetical protein F4861DRAFT_227377 [Xylaria intraflava]|nr:hypothetical protein F4861DRAFT_227377 [Xylaria intraflava]
MPTSSTPNSTLYQPRQSALKVDDPSQPWTTARCQRLLRPLVSHIASLRKAAIDGQPKVSLFMPISRTVTLSSISSSERHEEPNTDSEWLVPKKKRARLTYSQRRSTQTLRSQQVEPGQRQTQQGNHDVFESSASGAQSSVKRPFKYLQPEGQLEATAPGEIAPPTPLLRRARGELASSPVAPPREFGFGSNQTGLEYETKASTKTSLFLEAERLHIIFCNFVALLNATEPRNADNTNVTGGPPSLLEMCLRKVPQYIVELEAWEQLEAAESGTLSTLHDINTSAQIYNELESLGTNVGWRYLRAVVRADGVNTVKRAIQEDLFTDEVRWNLVNACISSGAWAEAEELLAVFVDRQYPQPASTNSSLLEALSIQPLRLLNNFAEKAQRTPFLLRQYSLLLSSGNLPRDWLVTPECRLIWSLATDRLASTGPNYDAMEFVTQFILLLCSRKRTFTGNADSARLEQDMEKASQRTLVSGLSILASMRLIGESRLSQPSVSTSNIRRVTLIGDRLKYVIRACLKGLESYNHGRAHDSLDLLYLALFLSSNQSQGAEVENHVRWAIAKLFHSAGTFSSAKEDRIRNNYENTAQLIVSIAQAYHRGASVLPREYLGGLFKRLESLDLAKQSLDNLRVVVIFLFAQKSTDLKDLMFAENQIKLHNLLNPSAPTHEHNGNTPLTGYYWEETIGEWVRASPVKDKRRASAMRGLQPSTLGGGKPGSLNRSTSMASLVTETEAMSDAEINLDEDLMSDDFSTDESTRLIDTERGTMMKKRPYRGRNIKTPPRTSEAETPEEEEDPSLSAVLAAATDSKLCEIQRESEKENWTRLLAKKPRRSSGRIVLGARPQRSQSCHLVGRKKRPRDGIYDDDELSL